MSTWWAFVGAVAAVGGETYFRAFRGHDWLALWPGIACGLTVNYAIFKLMQTETLIGAMILFGLMTATGRVSMTLWLGDPVPVAHWVAYGLVLGAAALKAVA